MTKNEMLDVWSRMNPEQREMTATLTLVVDHATINDITIGESLDKLISEGGMTTVNKGEWDGLPWAFKFGKAES